MNDQEFCENFTKKTEIPKILNLISPLALLLEYRKKITIYHQPTSSKVFNMIANCMAIVLFTVHSSTMTALALHFHFNKHANWIL